MKLPQITKPIDKLELLAQRLQFTLEEEKKNQVWILISKLDQRRKIKVEFSADKLSFIFTAFAFDYSKIKFGTPAPVKISLLNKTAMEFVDEVYDKVLVKYEADFKTWVDAARRHKSFLDQKQHLTQNILSLFPQAKVYPSGDIYCKTPKFVVNLEYECDGKIEFSFRNAEECLQLLQTIHLIDLGRK